VDGLNEFIESQIREIVFITVEYFNYFLRRRLDNAGKLDARRGCGDKLGQVVDALVARPRHKHIVATALDGRIESISRRRLAQT
jgi:hypothetical protein